MHFDDMLPTDSLLRLKQEEYALAHGYGEPRGPLDPPQQTWCTIF